MCIRDREYILGAPGGVCQKCQLSSLLFFYPHHLPVGDIALWHRSRQKRGHRDSVINKTIGAICSPQERVCRGSGANKNQDASCSTYRWGTSRCGIVRDKNGGIATVSPTKPWARSALRGSACAAAAKTRCGVNRNVVAGDAAVSRRKSGRVLLPARAHLPVGGIALWHRSR